ncbi:MAG TPA: hypothetical protein VI979_02005 [archaeon]|nr:hypothetical protein [archaeon]
MKYVLAAVALILFINVYLLLYVQDIELSGYTAKLIGNFFGQAAGYARPLAIVLLGTIVALVTLALRNGGRK